MNNYFSLFNSIFFAKFLAVSPIKIFKEAFVFQFELYSPLNIKKIIRAVAKMAIVTKNASNWLKNTIYNTL